MPTRLRRATRLVFALVLAPVALLPVVPPYTVVPYRLPSLAFTRLPSGFRPVGVLNDYSVLYTFVEGWYLKRVP